MDEIISMSHGNGGLKTSKLIDELILKYLNSEQLEKLGDGALLDLKPNVAFSTDSFVINPYFFIGGDIGKLSVCGTVNDLLMCGSIPRFLSLSFIIEEGFKISELEKIIKSIADACKETGVKVVTGDTKVVEKGHGDGIYINTSGIGEKVSKMDLGIHRIVPGDKIIVTGDVGDHGMSILCLRENFTDNISSDCNSLLEAAKIVFKYGDKIKMLRDPTRGGIATTLNEFAEKMQYSIKLYEDKIPIKNEVRGIASILGINPLYSANEGKMLIVVEEDVSEQLLNDLKAIEISQNSKIIGQVDEFMKSKVYLENKIGGHRILTKLSSDMLPRIC